MLLRTRFPSFESLGETSRRSEVKGCFFERGPHPRRYEIERWLQHKCEGFVGVALQVNIAELTPANLREITSSFVTAEQAEMHSVG